MVLKRLILIKSVLNSGKRKSVIKSPIAKDLLKFKLITKLGMTSTKGKVLLRLLS